MWTKTRSDRGFTLVEVMIAIAIIGVMAVVAFGGLAAFLKAAVVQRGVSDLDQVTRNYAEQIARSAYVECTSTPYTSVTLPPGGEYVFASRTVSFVQPSTPTNTYTANFASPAPPSCGANGTDLGTQRIDATIRKVSTNQTQHIVIAKRRTS